MKGEYGWGGLKGRGSSCEGELWGPEGGEQGCERGLWGLESGEYGWGGYRGLKGNAGLLGGFIRMAIGAPLGVRIEWGWVSLPSLRLPLHHFTPQLTHSPPSPRVPEMFKL